MAEISILSTSTFGRGRRRDDLEKNRDIIRYSKMNIPLLLFLFPIFPRDRLERKSEKTKSAWPKNAQLEVQGEPACLGSRPNEKLICSIGK